jgi:hypothetical protein
LVYFVVIWYILWQFGILYGHLVHFSPRKVWQPCSEVVTRKSSSRVLGSFCSLHNFQLCSIIVQFFSP